MAFALPDFNLECLLKHVNPSTPPAAPDLTSPCALAVYRPAAAITASESVLYVLLKLPKGTPLHGPEHQNGQQLVEVPKGTGRWYFVTDYDDVAKGYANEYRLACLIKNTSQGAWPYPTP